MDANLVRMPRLPSPFNDFLLPPATLQLFQELFQLSYETIRLIMAEFNLNFQQSRQVLRNCCIALGIDIFDHPPATNRPSRASSRQVPGTGGIRRRRGSSMASLSSESSGSDSE